MSNEKKGPVRQMVEHLMELEANAQSLKNEYLRLLADFDNFRKRIERDMEIRQEAEVAKLMADLLPVLDNFGRALSATAQLPQETARNCSNAESKERGVENGIMKGIDMIYKELCAVLAKHGLKEFSCLGEEFDPRVAEAISFVEKDKESENRVVEELCRGYEYRGRVLRPARVVVAKTINSGKEKV
ncbi:MAG: nucleotide exchange factor GrpE [candidate division WOR-3 bacterium]